MRISDWSSDVCSSDVGGNDGRALAAFEQPGDVGLARGLGFGVEAVVAFGVLAVAGELVEAGAGPDVRRYPKILVEQFGGGDDPAQDRSEEHTSELQSPMRLSNSVFRLYKNKN